VETSIKIIGAVLAVLTLALNCRYIWWAWADRNFKSLAAMVLALPFAVWLSWSQTHWLF
jgi:hypothetical protein